LEWGAAGSETPREEEEDEEDKEGEEEAAGAAAAAPRSASICVGADPGAAGGGLRPSKMNEGGGMSNPFATWYL